MMRFQRSVGLILSWFSLLFCLGATQAAPFRVATYNLENYLDVATDSRKIKLPESRAKNRESILALKPDVLAVQEIGEVSALKELQASLKGDGLDLPYSAHIRGVDTNIFVAVLSRFPILQNRSHTNENFLLNGRRHRVSRGFAELDLQVSSNFVLTVFTAHLKSKRAVIEGDEAELRLEEAKLLREKIDARLAANPTANIVVVGDFNDTKDSTSTRAVIGRGKTKLVDTRPAERNGDNQPNPNPAWEPRNITWTHYYGKEDSYSRIDYILASPALAQRWSTNDTYVLTLPNWAVGSDHRPIVAAFQAD
jgi:endonuclease/exonuclease/phosphatase family metal-dependent hydrolase